MAPQTHHFVLIHGGGYGAWCWFSITARLQKAGHTVTAMDMTGAGIHPADPDTINTFDEYHKPALDFFESLPENDKVVLVGHSMAGFALAQVMERFPQKISFTLFIAAVLSGSGLSLYDDTPLFQMMTSETAPKDIVVLAQKLYRPFPNPMLRTALTYTKEKYGQVPSVYIKYLNDNTFPTEAQEYVSSNSGPFKEIIELEGGHFNFLKRPHEFVQLLESLVAKYAV